MVWMVAIGNTDRLKFRVSFGESCAAPVFFGKEDCAH